MGKDAAFDKSIELVFDKLGQARRAPGFDMGEECFEMFAHQAIQGRFLRARLVSCPDDITDRNAEPELRSNPRGDAISAPLSCAAFLRSPMVTVMVLT